MATTAPLVLAEELPDAQRLMRRGQWSQALKKVDAHLAGQPKEVQGRFLKGVILTEMGRSAEAIVVFKGLSEDYPELPEPYNNLAVLYAQQKQYDKARAALEMAIRTHPSYSTAHENLGDVYAKLASQAYDKALQLDSSNRATQSKLSMIRELITTSAATTAGSAAVGQVTATASSGVAAQPVAAPVVAAAPTIATPPARPAEKSVALPAAPAPAEKLEKVQQAESVKKADKVEKPAPAQALAASPEPVKAPSAPPAGDEAAVNKELQGWARAWSGKNMKAYLGHYADDFHTPRGMSRKAWEAERTRRIDKPGKIEIEIDDVSISFAENQATASFKQHYRAAKLKSTVRKTLVLVKTKGRWLIVQERVA